MRKVTFSPEIPHKEERKTKKPTPTSISQHIKEETDVESLWPVSLDLLADNVHLKRGTWGSGHALSGDKHLRYKNQRLHKDNQRLRSERNAL